MPQSPANILIYEDEVAQSRRFRPLTYTRCLAELRSGAVNGIDRVRAHHPKAAIHLHASPHLASAIAKRHSVPVNEVPSGPVLLLNARDLFAAAPFDESLVFDRLPAEMESALRAGEPILSPHAHASRKITAIWDIIHENAALIRSDIALHHDSLEHKRSSHERASVHSVNPKEIFLARDARIDPGVVLDATEGPILIEHRTHVMSNATIIGPVAIGPDSVIKAGATLYHGSTIGPMSKIGGEVENSIVQGYSNKQHDGYLGHSFVGEWVNLGAGTNTSDLKNDYSTIRVRIEEDEFETHSQFVGLLMGDHSKSGIGVQFNTGTAVGISSNIFDAGFPPKWIPNFSWGGARGMTLYRFEKAIEVARKVMERRGATLSDLESAILRHHFDERVSVEV